MAAGKLRYGLDARDAMRGHFQFFSFFAAENLLISLPNSGKRQEKFSLGSRTTILHTLNTSLLHISHIAQVQLHEMREKTVVLQCLEKDLIDLLAGLLVR